MPFIIAFRDAPSDTPIAEFVGNQQLPVPESGERVEFTRHFRMASAPDVTIETFRGKVDRRAFSYEPIKLENPGMPQPESSIERWGLAVKVTVWLDQSS